MYSRTYQEAGRSMAEVVESHPRQTGSIKERLEVLGEPRPIDGIATRRDEDQPVIQGGVRTLQVLTVEMGLQPVEHEQWQRNGRL